MNTRRRTGMFSARDPHGSVRTHFHSPPIAMLRCPLLVSGHALPACLRVALFVAASSVALLVAPFATAGAAPLPSDRAAIVQPEASAGPRGLRLVYRQEVSIERRRRGPHAPRYHARPSPRRRHEARRGRARSGRARYGRNVVVETHLRARLRRARGRHAGRGRGRHARHRGRVLDVWVEAIVLRDGSRRPIRLRHVPAPFRRLRIRVGQRGPVRLRRMIALAYTARAPYLLMTDPFDGWYGAPPYASMRLGRHSRGAVHRGGSLRGRPWGARMALLPQHGAWWRDVATHLDRRFRSGGREYRWREDTRSRRFERDRRDALPDAWTRVVTRQNERGAGVMRQRQTLRLRHRR